MNLLNETMYSAKPRSVIGRALLNIHVELSFVRKANMAPSKGKNPRRTAVFWQVLGFFHGRKGRVIIALLYCFSDAEVRKKLLENLKKEVKWIFLFARKIKVSNDHGLMFSYSLIFCPYAFWFLGLFQSFRNLVLWETMFLCFLDNSMLSWKQCNASKICSCRFPGQTANGRSCHSQVYPCRQLKHNLPLR